MSQYLTNLTLAFGPTALLIGLLFALAGPLQSDARATRRAIAWSVAIGLAAGIVLAVAIAPQVSVTSLTTAIRATAMAVALLQLTALTLHTRSWAAATVRLPAWGLILLLSTVLTAQAVFDFLQHAAEQSLSVTEVLNTELILNIAAITIGAGVIGFLSFMSARMAGATPHLLWPLYLALLGLLLLQWSGDTMLGLLQLNLLELTRARLSFVGKVTNFSWIIAYLTLLLAAVLCFAFFRKRTRPDAADNALRAPQRRKLLARALLERRWLRSGLASLFFLSFSMLYYDLYASLPPTLSEAIEVQPDAQGIIRIPLEGITDGDLHRYAYISEDGHRVRFFTINVLASRDRVRMSTVYDACMICGDEGYIQDGNEVICIACNVRIFVPSIGKPGGCNPIPFPWEQDETHLLIQKAVLEKGAKYFSEIVEIEVRDPVTGNTLINLKAPYQYDFRGKTFYFENRDSFERFKADPLKYAGDTDKRYFRSESWQS